MRIVLLPGACAVAGVVFWLAVAIEACSPKPPAPGHQEAGPSEAAPPAVYTKAIVSNMTDAAVNVGVGFGADSVVKSWSFCDASGCLFPLAAGTSMELPTNGGQYLNVALSFGGPPQCGYTAGEFTANNANGYGTADISLVNGFNASVEIQISPGPDGGPIVLGPATDAGNGAALGVFPLACDICVARDEPPCGFDAGGCMTSGACGCKSGTQYNPTVPCQVTYQMADAGSLVNVMLLP